MCWYLFSASVNSDNINVKVFNVVDVESKAYNGFSALRPKHNDEILIAVPNFVLGYVNAETKHDAEYKLTQFLEGCIFDSSLDTKFIF